MKFPYVTVNEITPKLHGFYKISHEAYHQGPGISSSRLKKALVSRAAYEHPDNTDSTALAFGRAFHMAILEPGLYQHTYRTFKGASRNSKAWDDFSMQMRAMDKEAILESEVEQINGMIAAIQDHPEYGNLPDCDSEIMAITTCKETGLQIKCKSDLFGGAIVDFKSTSSGLTSSDFLYEVVKYKYHLSAAFYQDIIATLTGEKLPFIAVPVTKKAPFECEFYALSDELLEEGRKLYKAALRTIRNWEGVEKTVKRLRVLHSTPRVAYSTDDILDFLGG